MKSTEGIGQNMHKILLLSLSLLLFALGSTRLVAGERKVIIGLSVWTGYPDNIRGFKETMAAAGFTENETVTYLYGKSNIDTVTQRAIATQFKDSKVDLVYSLTTPGTVIIKEVWRNAPGGYGEFCSATSSQDHFQDPDSASLV